MPDQSEAIVLIDQNDSEARAKLDEEIRAYYQGGADADDDAWAAATSRQSHLAWDEE